MLAPILMLALLFVGTKPEASLAASGIPVLLPHVFNADIVSAAHGKIYATVDEVAKGTYTVSLDYTEDCDGGTACNIGSMEGGVTDAVSGSQSVQLANGIAARFEPYACGASCGNSTLMFRYKGATYRLGLKAGRKADLVAAANSLFQ